jgi:hypothetical protein
MKECTFFFQNLESARIRNICRIDIGALAYQGAAIMLRGHSAQAPPTFRARGYFVKSRVLIKTKQGNFNIRGERVKGGRSEVMGHG